MSVPRMIVMSSLRTYLTVLQDNTGLPGPGIRLHAARQWNSEVGLYVRAQAETERESKSERGSESEGGCVHVSGRGSHTVVMVT